MENEENQNQVSLRFPPPLEIAPRFPHFHNSDDDSPLPKTQNQKPERSPSDSKSPNPRLQAHPSMRKCLGWIARISPGFGQACRLRLTRSRYKLAVALADGFILIVSKYLDPFIPARSSRPLKLRMTAHGFPESVQFALGCEFSALGARSSAKTSRTIPWCFGSMSFPSPSLPNPWAFRIPEPSNQ